MVLFRHVWTTTLICGMVFFLTVDKAVALTPEAALDQAQALASINRYADALRLLEPLISDDLKDPVSWEIAAEAGRAAFHLGQYTKAHEILRAVVEARPVVFEPAVYLEATSYLLGDHAQAYAIFEAILRSGVQDLYLAVTLPGETRFFNEPEIQVLLNRYSQPLTVRPESARVQATRLGQNRSEIARHWGISDGGGGSTLTARAGPFLTWIYTFDDQDLLAEVVLNAAHLRRYTPFDLDLSEGISWESTPIACIGSLGAPTKTSATDDGALILTWTFPEAWLDLVFSRNNHEKDGAATLEMVRLYEPPETKNKGR